MIKLYYFLFFTAGQGLEPRYWASKAHVLPLDDPAITSDILSKIGLKNNLFKPIKRLKTETIYDTKLFVNVIYQGFRCPNT